MSHPRPWAGRPHPPAMGWTWTTNTAPHIYEAKDANDYGSTNTPASSTAPAHLSTGTRAREEPVLAEQEPREFQMSICLA